MQNLKAKKILSLLKKRYPNAKIILNYSNNFELLVSVILSAQTTDIQVNKVTAVVFPKYQKENKKLIKFYAKYKDHNLSKKELIEIVNFAFSDLGELENDIKSIGLYKTKAKNVKNMAIMLLKDFKGVLPKTIDNLIKLAGVGRKTANVFLGNAYGIVEGIAVDTHVKRLSLKYGFTKSSNPKVIEKDLMKIFPKKDWFSVTYLLIEHGKTLRKLKKDFIA
ncbi:MAG: endonuclease III [Candidatus Levybacteria bacterium]|nr:endonuclease III [Candidatus Levybacteria bacterium]